MMVASQAFPKSQSELDFAGGLLGRPVELTPGVATDLPVPADAEVVIEGTVEPGDLLPEGPFGEFSGYYGHPGGPSPVIRIKAVHHRSNPILTAALMADYPACEMALFNAVFRSARVWNDLDALGIPGIRGVYCHPAAASGFGMVVVSFAQRYAGHAKQVLALASQVPGAAYFSKWCIGVDEDVDPSNLHQVLWAMSTRCNPVDDLDFLRDTWSTTLDPAQFPVDQRPYGSKVLINACKNHKYLAQHPPRAEVRRSVYDDLCRRWPEFGLTGPPPALPGLLDG